MADSCLCILASPADIIATIPPLSRTLCRLPSGRDFDVALHVVFKDKSAHDAYQKTEIPVWGQSKSAGSLMARRARSQMFAGRQRLGMKNAAAQWVPPGDNDPAALLAKLQDVIAAISGK